MPVSGRLARDVGSGRARVDAAGAAQAASRFAMARRWRSRSISLSALWSEEADAFELGAVVDDLDVGKALCEEGQVIRLEVRLGVVGRGVAQLRSRSSSMTRLM